MTEFLIYLLKSAAWLAGFAFVYILFLRNERYFALNRFYLLSGIIFSFILPLITLHYYTDFQANGIQLSGIVPATEVNMTDSGRSSNGLEQTLIFSFAAIYVSGMLFFLSTLLIKTITLFKTIGKAGSDRSGSIKLVRTTFYTSSFSFFSWVFINPSATETETREIMKHEEVHIRQKHWIDLLLAELLFIIQWFNPLVWIYNRFIRQNHEYLADDEVLNHTSDPSVYRAALLNQMIGSPVFNLANFFSFSLDKKRFKMMKKIEYSPLRKLRVLAIMPVIALLLYAFAEPEYRTTTENILPISDQVQKIVKGVVVDESGNPLEGAAVVISGTTVGTTTDKDGRFVLKEVPEEPSIIISYVGFKTLKVKAQNTGEQKIKMEKATIAMASIEVKPEANVISIGGTSLNSPVIYMDGIKIDKEQIENIDPNIIQSVSVLKDQSATAVFGEEGKNGVILITTKKGGSDTGNSNNDPKPTVVEGDASKNIYTVVEEMPSFPGGESGLMAWIGQNIKYPEDAAKNKVSGVVVVSFVVNKSGNVEDVKVVKSINKSLDNEAVRVIKTLPGWKPGKQNGKPVDVLFNLPVSFML